MKIISYILSVYLLVLSLVPCSDSMVFIHSECEANTELVDSNKNHSDHEHEDLCTPFCICACCGSVAAMPTILDYIGIFTKISTPCIYISLTIFFDYSKGLWHPPALG